MQTRRVCDNEVKVGAIHPLAANITVFAS